MTTKRTLLYVLILAVACLGGQREADALSVSRNYSQLADFYRQWDELDGPTRAKVRQVYDEMVRVGREYIENWRRDPSVLGLDDASLGAVLEKMEYIESRLNLLEQTGSGGEINMTTAREFYGVELDATADLFLQLGNQFDAMGL